MRRVVHAAAAASLLMAVAGCQNVFGDADGPLTGTWRFVATEYQPMATDASYTCDVTTTYVMRQEGTEIEGRSDEATMQCRHAPNTHGLPDTKFAGVVRGPVEGGTFDLSDSGTWHCLGEVPPGKPTRLEGHLESYGGYVGQPMQTIRRGTCVLEKISDAGYDGPAA